MKQLEGRDIDSDEQSAQTTKTTQSTTAKLAEALAMIARMQMVPPGQILVSPDPKARAPAPEELPDPAAARTGSQI
jgi:hypothetical protein